MEKILNVVRWIKKHILVFIIGVGVIIGAVATPIIVHNVNEKNKVKIELNDNLNFELDSDVYLLSLIKRISNGQLVTENKKIDTSKLEEQEIKIKYLDNKNKENEYKFKIKIVDTTKPIIEYQKELSTIVGSDIDLLKDVKVSDNSKEEIKATIDGNYDINKIGTYNLKYIAIDSSNNKTEEEFSLNVKPATIKVGGSYYSNFGKILSVSFETNNKVSVEYDTGCTLDMPCGGYGEYGIYKINGNKIDISLTHYYNMSPEMDGSKLDNQKKLEFTIINENQIKNGTQAFNYK